jgi:hypothetical protein
MSRSPMRLHLLIFGSMGQDSWDLGKEPKWKPNSKHKSQPFFELKIVKKWLDLVSSDVQLWLQHFFLIFGRTHWWTLPFLMGPWALSLGLSLSHYNTPTPKNNIKNNIVSQGLDFHRILPLVGGTYEIGPLRWNVKRSLDLLDIVKFWNLISAKSIKVLW